MASLNAVDLEGLRGFVAIARHASFQLATTELNISAPALTRRIQRLEAAIGAPLFERTTRRVQLTPIGELLLPRARDILANLADALSAVDDALASRSGQLSLGCIPTATKLLLPHILRAFHEQRPQTRIRIAENNVAGVTAAVLNGTVDFGITLQPAAGAGLAFDALLTEPFLLACPLDHPLAERRQVDWSDLKPYRLIVSEPGSGNRAVLEQALRKWRWQRDHLVEIDHLTSSLGLVEAGLGISVVPLSALPDLPDPRLAIRALGGPRVTRTLGLLRRRAIPLGAVAQQFRRSVRQLAPLLQSQAAERAARYSL
ncbi:LysR family transcriptional regulator [Bordetella genomosp. 9]|uniref:LysR family transcriptional regulator n=1 Tax=Bordetella genomosp. 9 TaxID=1416803 RepID=A0A261RMW9_9BORD|nr:LysR family transcriptional regulator [Bordetella genomosp. 9]OZI26414.1 LysR family transcriptional regulator [Bordetella genomosp. 9]